MGGLTLFKRWHLVAGDDIGAFHDGPKRGGCVAEAVGVGAGLVYVVGIPEVEPRPVCAVGHAFCGILHQAGLSEDNELFAAAYLL